MSANNETRRDGYRRTLVGLKAQMFQKQLFPGKLQTNPRGVEGAQPGMRILGSRLQTNPRGVEGLRTMYIGHENDRLQTNPRGVEGQL